MKCLDRLAMLKKLTFIGEKNINIFNSYIPDHYDEIYTLYDIIKKASLDYENISFYKPIEHEKSFVFVCDLNNQYFDILSDYLNENKNRIKCTRNKEFEISIKFVKDNKTHIKFKIA